MIYECTPSIQMSKASTTPVISIVCTKCLLNILGLADPLQTTDNHFLCLINDRL